MEGITTIIKSKSVFIDITGEDKFSFLQSLITNDIYKIKLEPLIFAALLTPQGRFLCDFFIFYVNNLDKIVVVIDDIYKEIFLEKIQTYKLRSRIKTNINEQYHLYHTLYWSPERYISKNSIITVNPRSNKIGYIIILNTQDQNFLSDYNIVNDNKEFEILCLENLILNSAKYMNNKSFPLEFRFDQQQALDSKKGCFIGQEIISMMKNRNLLKRKIYIIIGDNIPKKNQEILYDNQKIGLIIEDINPKKAIALLSLEHLEIIKNNYDWQIIGD